MGSEMCIRDSGCIYRTDRRDMSNQISILVQQYSSYPDAYLVTYCSSLRTFLEDRLARINEHASGFPSEPIRSTPSVPPPLSLQAPSPVLRGTRLLSRCAARSFLLRTRASKSSANPQTHICMRDLAINKEHHDKTACCSFVPNKPILFFHSVQTDWRM